ncbi:MAG: V-type ATP synthase subunit F [bacterium]
MSKIAAIGPDNLFGGFRALGVDVLPTNKANEAREMLEKISRTREYEIIFILENLAVNIKDVIEKISRQTSPSLVVLPGTTGTVGHGVSRINEFVRKASGQDII